MGTVHGHGHRTLTGRLLRAGCRGAGAALAVLAAAAVPAGATEIVSAGPLRTVGTTADLNCYVNHVDDAVPEFFGTTACGTLVATPDTLYGPANIPAGGNAAPRTAWRPESQSAVSGSGTAADPYQVTTVVTGGSLRLTQVDSYQVGLESYRTDVTVQNTGAPAQSVVVYRAGDCYLANSDNGFGRVDSGAPTCVEANGDGTPGDRIEQFTPITGTSHYYHAGYWEVWQAIGTRQPFPDTCRCDEYIDNGAGVSWTRAIEAGQSVTVSGLITFSPTGNLPLAISKTTDDGTVSPGGASGYTIRISNPNQRDVSLTTLVDDLPPGFAYLTGSTSGLTNADPAISGQRLTWTGPYAIPANSTATLHFGVAVATEPGTYRNTASGTADSYTVVPAEEEAPVEVPVSPVQTAVADVVVAKTADAPGAFAGEDSGYTVTLENPTTSPLKVTRIDETLHPGVTYQEGSTTGVTTADPTQDGRHLRWDVDVTIPARASVQLHFGVRLPLDAAGALRNPRITATEQQGTEEVRAVLAASAPIVVTPPAIRGSLRLRKRFASPVVTAGRSVRVRLTVTDLAPKTATITRICDRVPRGLILVAAPGANRVGRRICWRLALPKDIPTRSVRYVVRAAAGTRGRVASLATVTGVARDPAQDRAGVLVRGRVRATPPTTTG